MTDSPEPSLKWSKQLTVSSTRSRQLHGDKILLPASALEALLSASSNSAAENARRNLPEYDPYNSSTYSAYRQAESQYQDQRQQLPHPLTFRLVNPKNGRVAYAGIREFSAEEGEIVLSPFLQETLGLRAQEGSEEDPMIIDGGDSTSDTLVHEPTITVHAKQLPKGLFVKLRPLEAGYDPEDWKALLEQYLRQNYTTLTNGEILVVPGGKGFDGKQEFRFLVDGFRPETDGVCIVDTDLEVDIEALNEEQARETLKRIAAKMAKAPGTDQGNSAGGELNIFKAQQGQVLPGEYVDYELSSWDKSQALEFELESAAGDEEEEVELLVSPLSATQRARPRLDEYVFADFDGQPRKRIRLQPTNIELENADALYVSVYAFTPVGDRIDGNTEVQKKTAQPRRYTLRVLHPDAGIDADENENTSEAPPNEGDVRCGNCRQWVPQRTLMLHENFCLRNNTLCPKGCGQVFQKRSNAFEQHWHCPHDMAYGNSSLSRQKHDALMHPPDVLRCEECGTQETFSSVPALARHRTTTCPAKLILCRFCHLVVPQEGDPDVPNAEALLSGLTPHELADGARTTECHLCNKIVRLRDMETHLKNHDLDRFSRPPPNSCRNVNCGRTLDTCSKSGDTRAGSRMGQGSGNDIGLCSVCFGPLYVSMYDPEGKALRRRIERRYLQQLVTGCNKPWCQNEYCKTGRQHLGINSTVTTKDALPMIKPFLDGLAKGRGDSPLHFCVDEKSQNRRTLAEMLAADANVSAVKGGGYDFEWCVGALEAEGGDMEGARQWLKNWAPTRQELRR